MSETDKPVDAILSEVDALAQEAVEDIVGAEAAEEEPTPAPPAPSRPAAREAQPIKPAIKSGDEDIARILHLQVPVIVQLAQRTMPLAEIVNLSTGAIIEFNKPADADLDLMINNKGVAKGQAVKAGENFGLRITEIGSVQDRIQALGRT